MDELIKDALAAFARLADHCEHRSWSKTDCEHPDIDFSCMCCAPCNCPLLLVETTE
jgi:hypothetical protein